jgi:hypothetical protein
MTLPFRHFLVAGGLLLLGLFAGIGTAVGLHSSLSLVHVHPLLAGWVCVTIMGAMTQFVPVWSGTQLHSDRLAAAQLWLVAGGLGGFALSLLTGSVGILPVAGAAMLVGFWSFVYNIGRTLATVSASDVTERHFAIALGYFLLVTLLGFLLAADFVSPVIGALPVTRANVVASHATLAVFGAVPPTVLGALYQLSTMFTQTELHGIDVPVRRFEEAAYPLGVLLLATGRLLDVALLARIGGVLVGLSLLGVAVILGRRLAEMQVDWTPMLSRYAVATASLTLWALLTLPHWAAHPLDRNAVFGAPGLTHLLVLGTIGFIVLGTLYHVVPFIIWVHRYSDLLGYERVPMIDDLYDDRLAAADLACLGAGLFSVNLLLVIRSHSPIQWSKCSVATDWQVPILIRSSRRRRQMGTDSQDCWREGRTAPVPALVLPTRR